jgi:gliding motility-associated-like protein
LQTGELTSVCIGDALMVAGNLTPFAVTLTCPSGNTITLANVGDLTGTTLNNTCFDLISSTPLSAGTSPYNGTFQPVNPLTNLNGCSGNGVWTLSLTGTFNLSGGTLPIGFLNGWDVSFDDPEIAYAGDFAWSPSTNLSATDILTPTACPPANTTYTLVVSDTAGCASDSASVLVTVDQAACCPINIAFTTVAPDCGVSNGSIDITTTNGSGNYSYAWSNGLPNTEDVTSLGLGTYTLTITDNVQMCSRDTTIVLTPLSAPIISGITLGTVSCLNNDGSIVITASGGTGNLQYSIDGGISFQPASSFNGLTAGSYVVVVEDAASCSVTEQALLLNSPGVLIDNVTVQNETCGAGNGQFTLIASGGTGALSYSIDGGLTFQAVPLFNGLSAGTYALLVEDQNGCSTNQSIIVGNESAPVIASVLVTNTTCASDNGALVITVTGGAPPLEYSIDNGLIFQTSNTFSALPSGPYTVIVREQGNIACSTNSTVFIDASTGINIDNVEVLNESCFGANDGSIELTISGGTAPYTLTYNGQTGNVLNENLAPGTYDMIVTDDEGCVSSILSENIASGIVVDIETINDTSIAIGQLLELTTSLNGAAGGTYTWLPITDLSCSDCANPEVLVLQDISYQVVYTDASNTCSDSAMVNISAVAEDPFCLFPNAFSPNGDSYNDVFRAICDELHQVEIKIYNRWGELIFRDSGLTALTQWDGNVNGKKASLDVYIYVANIEYINGAVETITGNFTLIR